MEVVNNSSFLNDCLFDAEIGGVVNLMTVIASGTDLSFLVSSVTSTSAFPILSKDVVAFSSVQYAALVKTLESLISPNPEMNEQRTINTVMVKCGITGLWKSGDSGKKCHQTANPQKKTNNNVMLSLTLTRMFSLCDKLRDKQ